MRKWIALSLLFALALVVVARLAAQTAQSSAKPTIGSERFRIVMRDGVRADTFLLDTETGRIWSRIQYTNVKGAPDVWVFEERLDNDTQREAWGSKIEVIPSTSRPGTN